MFVHVTTDDKGSSDSDSGTDTEDHLCLSRFHIVQINELMFSGWSVA